MTGTQDCEVHGNGDLSGLGNPRRILCPMVVYSRCQAVRPRRDSHLPRRQPPPLACRHRLPCFLASTILTTSTDAHSVQCPIVRGLVGSEMSLVEHMTWFLKIFAFVPDAWLLSSSLTIKLEVPKTNGLTPTYQQLQSAPSKPPSAPSPQTAPVSFCLFTEAFRPLERLWAGNGQI